MDRRYALKSGAAAGFTALVAGCSRGSETGSKKQGDLVEVINSIPNLSSFASAVAAAGLNNAMASEYPLTIFAPSNRAFSELPSETVAMLKMPENENMLIALVANHAIKGSFPLASLEGTQGPVTTKQSRTLQVDGSDGVKVEDATVIAADFRASNGIIHVIDKVLLPK